MAAVVWTEKEQTSFNALKDALTTAPVLATPDPDLKYHIYTDACGYGGGCQPMPGAPRRTQTCSFQVP